MTRFLQKIFLATTLTFLILVPQTALAQSSNASCDELKAKFTNYNGTEVTGLPAYCTVESVYAKFINIAFYAVGIVAVIMIIYGGYMYMTARGNADQAKKGRMILTWAIIGLIIVLAASAIVNAVVKLVVEK